MDAFDLAVAEFCYGGGRAIPRSVFLGRVVQPGEPLWLDGDTAAALEYQTYLKSLCPGGCGRPRSESFDKAMDDHYEAVAFQCHACAERARKVYNLAASNDGPNPALTATFFAVQPEESEQVGADV